MERRKSCSKHREVGADQQQRTDSNERNSHDRPLGEIPIREGGHRVEKFFWVDSFEANRQYVG